MNHILLGGATWEAGGGANPFLLVFLVGLAAGTALAIRWVARRWDRLAPLNRFFEDIENRRPW